MNYDGKYVGVSKCNPEDKYDFNIGIKLAYDRAIENKKKTEEGEDKKIKVGDTVRVVDTGRLFTTNVTQVIKMANNQEEIAHYCYNDALGYPKRQVEDNSFEVLSTDDKFAFIQSKCSKGCYLIGLNGIKKV